MNANSPDRKPNRPVSFKTATKVGLATTAAVVAISTTACNVTSIVDSFMKTAAAETKAPATWDPNKGLESRTPRVEAQADPTGGLFPLLEQEVPMNLVNFKDVSRKDVRDQEKLADFETQVGSKLVELTNYRVVTGDSPEDSVSFTFVKLENNRSLALFIKENDQQEVPQIVAGSFQIRGVGNNWQMELVNTPEKGLVFIAFNGATATFRGVNGEEIVLNIQQQEGIFNAIFAENTPTPEVKTATPVPTASPIPPTEVPRPSPTPEATKVSIPEGMEALGATAQKMVFNRNNGRWEYLGESMKSTVVAYWDTENKKLALSEGTTSLDFAEYKGFFTRWSPADVEAKFVASGYTQVPVMVDSEVGGMCEGKELRSGIGYRDLPEGTAVLSPMSAIVDHAINTFPDGRKGFNTTYLRDLNTATDVLSINYPQGAEELASNRIIEGGLLVKLNSEKLDLSSSCWASSQVLISNEVIEGLGFEDLMQDELGRLVVIKQE